MDGGNREVKALMKCVNEAEANAASSNRKLAKEIAKWLDTATREAAPEQWTGGK